MKPSNEYLKFIRDQLAHWRPIMTKPMFGCTGLYAEGLMFGIIANEIIFLKVDQTNIDNYIKADSEPLKVFKNNTIVPSFYNVPITILEDHNQLMLWAEEALQIQLKKQ